MTTTLSIPPYLWEFQMIWTIRCGCVCVGLGILGIPSNSSAVEKVTKAGFAQKELSIEGAQEFEDDADAQPPQFGYISASIGAFTLDGKKGQASFIYNHDLNVDWHAHTLTFKGEKADSAGNKYWIYAIDNHEDELLAFSQKQASGFPDEGYRIFYIHVEGDDTHTHLVAWDAKRLPYHKHHRDDQ